VIALIKTLDAKIELNVEEHKRLCAARRALAKASNDFVPRRTVRNYRVSPYRRTALDRVLAVLREKGPVRIKQIVVALDDDGESRLPYGTIANAIYVLRLRQQIYKSGEAWRLSEVTS
jgi:hypothetical protein